MKARNKLTGEVVEVEWSNALLRWNETKPSRKNNHYENSDYIIYQAEPTVEPSPDWSQIKIQASIAAMQGLCAANPINLQVNIGLPVSDVLATLSVYYAESLITELKKSMQ